MATEGLARVPGTTPQRPGWPGQSSGQSQSVWQGYGFRIGWSRPRLWEEGEGRLMACSRSPSFSLPASPLRPLSPLPQLEEEGGGEMPNTQRTEESEEEGFGSFWHLFSKY